MDINKFNQNESIMKLFIDNAKTYIQLSTGAIVFSVTFIEKIVRPETKPAITKDFFLIFSWVAFLIAIGFGAYYQYLAVKYLEFMSSSGGAEIKLPKWLTDPGRTYFIMMVAFYLGAILFTITAIKKVWPQ
jgi:hypothetical protein